MRLLIVSHTPHYRSAGRLVGWGPTVREIDHLATLFDRITHVAPLHAGNAPPSALAYESANVLVRPVEPAGGEDVRSKLGILRRLPSYARVIRDEMSRADALHVRSPANISLVAIAMACLRKSPTRRWFKYAGNWRPGTKDPWSYRFQRWLLARGWHRGTVTVNGTWSGDPVFVRPFLNPSFTRAEWERNAASSSVKALGRPVRILFVGRLESEKGAGRCVKILARLRRSGVEAKLDLVGDGPERGVFARLVESLEVIEHVRFHGWLPRAAVDPVYAESHFLLLPSAASEGWPKVLSEGMSYGTVPLAGNVSCIGQLLRDYGTGSVHEPEDIDAFAGFVRELVEQPNEWSRQSLNARKAAVLFTYEAHLSRVAEVLSLRPREMS